MNNCVLLCSMVCFLCLIVWDNALTALNVEFDHVGRSEQNPNDSVNRQKVQFNPVQFSSGRKANGAHFSAGIYDSTDGVGVKSTVEVYYSAARSKHELTRRIKAATKIIERGNKIMQNGKVVGKRVVLISPGGTRDTPYVAVLWVDREDLHVIESISLQHVLEFERSFYR